MEKISYLGQTLHKWQVGTSTFLAMPEKGARLMSWYLTLGDKSVRDVIYWPEVKSLDEFHKIRGGNPILFPFAGRSFDGGDLGFWRGPDGVRRPMPMHGIARQGKFKITRLDEGGFSAMLVPDAEAKEAYPYDYEFTVAYHFAPLAVFVELSLKNLGSQPIPWSAGHHFYFTIPWTDGLRRDAYRFNSPAAKTLRWDPQGKLIPGPVVSASVALNSPDLVDTFHTQLKSDVATVTEQKSGDALVFRVGTGKTPPKDNTIVTWTLDNDAPFYCVEPWMGPANAAENKVGLFYVQPGATQAFVVDVSVK